MSSITSTVLSLSLPVRDTDEAAVEAGAPPDLFRIRVPHARAEGGELTKLQLNAIKLAELNVREVHLPINKRFKYPKPLGYLNSLSNSISTLYNEWAEQDADVEDDDDDEEEEEEEEEDDDESADDDASEDASSPPAKKTKTAHSTAPYEMPCVTELTPAVLAAHLNLARPAGAEDATRVDPYVSAPDEHFVVVHVMHDE
jgi:hypothetical protein